MTTEDRIRIAEGAIRAAGFELRYVEYCEDAETPGLLGMYRGATNQKTKQVKIATHGHSREAIAEALAHELHHVLDPAWKCGSSPVI